MKNELEQLLVDTIPEASAFFEEMKGFEFSLDTIDINHTKGKRAFDKLQLQILKSKIQKPKPTDFATATLENNIQAAIDFFRTFLDPMSAEPLKTTPIIRSTTLPIFDAATEFSYDLEKKTITPIKIKIYKKDISYNALALIHENTHVLFNRQVQTGFHYHYNELLPILMELIATTQLETTMNDPALLENYLKIRLHTLQEFVMKFSQGIVQKKQLKTILPDIQLVLDYTIHNSYSYIISFVFAYHLFEQYKENPESIRQTIIKCITHQESIENILKQRQVTLKNPETVKATEKILKIY